MIEPRIVWEPPNEDTKKQLGGVSTQNFSRPLIARLVQGCRATLSHLAGDWAVQA